jgi:hypothetical protein
VVDKSHGEEENDDDDNPAHHFLTRRAMIGFLRFGLTRATVLPQSLQTTALIAGSNAVLVWLQFIASI